METKAVVDVLCTYVFSMYTLTEFDEWKPIPDYYVHCDDFVRERKTATLNPMINKGIAQILVTPGGKTDIDSAYLNVTYKKS
ncbi:hypothetical protein HY640_02785 [Candidatus Woesearchaeota archaeon]|nr:hypothetical protein [Candidatus Woesearchaeota archaeon]